MSLIFSERLKAVGNSATHKILFSTELDTELKELLKRPTMNRSVIDNVVKMWNESMGTIDNNTLISKIDGYLLDEGDCSQEEREVIIDSLPK